MGPNFYFDFEAFLQSVIELRICVKKGSLRERGKGQRAEPQKIDFNSLFEIAIDRGPSQNKIPLTSEIEVAMPY